METTKSSVDEWIKMCYIYIYIQYYSAMGRKKILPFVTIWMNFESLILSERSQTEKNEYRMIPLMCMFVLSRFSHIQLFVIPWTVTHQSPLSMGFSRQEYWSGLPCPPSRGSFPPRDQTCISCDYCMAGDSLPLSHQGSHDTTYMWNQREVSS